MMKLEVDARYYPGQGYVAVALPYAAGEVEFVAVMPNAATFESFTDTLTGDIVHAVLDDLAIAKLDLTLPRFEIEAAVPLEERLKSLGMRRAFDPSLAEFQALSPDRRVFLSNVFHDATLTVDEDGTEGAAATAAVTFVDITPEIAPTGVPVRFDHPFIFFVRDVPTDTVLFVGQFVSP
jgi:serpin B